MIERLLAAAERHADRVAIEDATGAAITYRALFAEARAMRAREPVVEVIAERTPQFVARCLGAWLAGCAFTPIDPDDPRPRPRLATHGLAYAIATSGSAGTPKRVLVSPRGLPALLTTQIDAFELGPGARSLWLHAPLFDASISDWGTALASGGTLVIPRAGVLASPGHLRAELERRAITHVDLPPSLLGYLDPLPPALRVVVLGGEACDVGRVRALARRVRVVVVYGPTEATVCSSLAVVDPERWDRPLVGTPLPGVTYRVASDGELLIAGDDALAVGYDDPVETARRFVTIEGTRWYCSGDRVEATPHGLAFVGRIDRQCKLRGRRIELDEVEIALRRHASDAAVVVRGERLVAFVTEPVDRAQLALPAWMQPARFVVGPLPRTTTGKIDRTALATRELPLDIPYTEPRERALAIAWCKVLGVERVDPEARFSAAGGDSLARLMFHAATNVTIDGDPTFAEVVAGEPRIEAMAVVEAEVRGLALAADIHAARDNAAAGHGSASLVTGATGFLGRALVRALRAHGRSVIALVRRQLGESDEALASDAVVVGDVALPRFGLDRDAWQALRDRVGEVYHCAATIRIGGTWDDHVATNVRGTAEVARFAARIPWHHISTLSVFVHTDAHAPFTARTMPAGRVYGGYAASKVAAEAIARAYGAASIARLGLLVGEGDRGQLPRTIRGLAKLGCAPAGHRHDAFDATPVDSAARAIVEGAARGGIYHVANPRSVSCGEVIDRLGVHELDHEAWLALARERADDPDIAMAIAAFSGARDRSLFLAAGFDVHDELPAFDIVAEALR